MKPPYKVQCQIPTCSQYKFVWTVEESDMTVSSRLAGLVDIPDLRCKGCGAEPVKIRSEDDLIE